MFKLILNNGTEIELTYPELKKEMNIRGMKYNLDVIECGGLKNSLNEYDHACVVSLGSDFVMGKITRV